MRHTDGLAICYRGTKQLILSAQRQVLRKTIRSYATASMDCLPFIAVLPMDLYLEKRIHVHQIWRDHSRDVGENSITEAVYGDPVGRTTLKQLVDDWLIQKWQEKWMNSIKGRHTYEFFPDFKKHLGEKMDLAKLLLHTDSDKVWIILGQAADIGISGHWRL